MSLPVASRKLSLELFPANLWVNHPCHLQLSALAAGSLSRFSAINRVVPVTVAPFELVQHLPKKECRTTPHPSASPMRE